MGNIGRDPPHFHRIAIPTLWGKISLLATNGYTVRRADQLLTKSLLELDSIHFKVEYVQREKRIRKPMMKVLLAPLRTIAVATASISKKYYVFRDCSY